MPLPNGILPPSLKDDVSSLVGRVKLQELIPNSDVTFSDDQVIDLMGQELVSFVVPLVIETRQEYFVVTEDVQLPAVTGSVNVQNWVEIPDESTGLMLRDVYVIDQFGNFTNLPRLSPEQVASLMPGAFWSSSYTPNNLMGTAGFYLQGNRLYLYPYSLASNRGLRLTYQRRPNRLVATSSCAQVLSIVGDTITIGVTVGQWASGDYVCFVSNALPHDFVRNLSATQPLYSSSVGLDAVAIGSASGNTFTFATGVTASLKVGDWMCNYSTSCFAQLIPLEASNLLVAATATRLLEALGDREGQAAAQARQDRMAKDLVRLISPRVIGKTPKISIPSRLSTAANLGWRTL